MTIVEEIAREKEQFDKLQAKAKLVIELITERIRICEKIGDAQALILTNIVPVDTPLYQIGTRTIMLCKENGLRWKMKHDRKSTYKMTFGLSNKDLYDFIGKKDMIIKILKPDKAEIFKKYLEKIELLVFERPEDVPVPNKIIYAGYGGQRGSKSPGDKLIKMNLNYYSWPNPTEIHVFICLENIETKGAWHTNVSLSNGCSINEMAITDQLFHELNLMLDKEMIQKAIEIENVKKFYNDISQKFADILYLKEIEKGDENERKS